MYRIELAPGEETVFRTLEELAVAVRNGLVTPRSRIYHNASQKWLPVEFHPHYKKALELPAPRPAEPGPRSVDRPRFDTLSFAVPQASAESRKLSEPAGAPKGDASGNADSVSGGPSTSAVRSSAAARAEGTRDGPEGPGGIHPTQAGATHAQATQAEVPQAPVPPAQATNAPVTQAQAMPAQATNAPATQAQASAQATNAHAAGIESAAAQEGHAHATDTKDARTTPHRGDVRPAAQAPHAEHLAIEHHGTEHHGTEQYGTEQHAPSPGSGHHNDERHTRHARADHANLGRAASEFTTATHPATGHPTPGRSTSNRPSSYLPPSVRVLTDEAHVAASPAAVVLPWADPHPAPADSMAPALMAAEPLELPNISYPEITLAEEPAAERPAARLGRRPLQVAVAVLVLAAGGFLARSLYSPMHRDASAAPSVERPAVPQARDAAAPDAGAARPDRGAVAPDLGAGGPSSARVVSPAAPASSGFAAALEPRAMTSGPLPRLPGTAALPTARAGSAADSAAGTAGPIEPAPAQLQIEVPALPGGVPQVSAPSARSDSAMKRILRAVSGKDSRQP